MISEPDKNATYGATNMCALHRLAASDQPHPLCDVMFTANTHLGMSSAQHTLLPVPPTLGCHLHSTHSVTSLTHFGMSSAQQTLCYQPHPPWAVICTAHTLLPVPPTLGRHLHSTHPVTSPTHFGMITFTFVQHNLWPVPPTSGCHLYTTKGQNGQITLCCTNVLAPPPLQCTQVIFWQPHTIHNPLSKPLSTFVLPPPPTLGCHLHSKHSATSPTHLGLSSAQHTLCDQPHPPWAVICTAHTLLPAPPTL